MKWREIPGAAQMVSGVITSIVLIGGAMIAGYSHFQTDDEADLAHTTIRDEIADYQLQHANELVKFRVQQIEQQIAGYRYQLLSSQLSQPQREWILQEIVRLEQQKACIIDGKC